MAVFQEESFFNATKEEFFLFIVCGWPGSQALPAEMESLGMRLVCIYHMVDCVTLGVAVGRGEAEFVGGWRLSPVGGAGGQGLLFSH